MRQQRLLLLLLLLSILLAACSPGHLGGNEIAFVRDGHLWTVDPDGANAFEVVSSNLPVIGYALSPDHQMFVYRELDSHYASTPAGKHLQINSITGLPGDFPSSLYTIGIDGGSPIPIIGSLSNIQYSNAWWIRSGEHLLYREESTNLQGSLPSAVIWWVSQNDQPNGIARIALPASFSIPSFSTSSLAIGNSLEGIFLTTLAGADLHIVVHGTLPGHPLPATLERVLWQPSHQQPLLLYAVKTTIAALPVNHNATTPPVQLVLNNGAGQISSIATCYCTQFAWSPDGNSILYSTGETYGVYNFVSHTTYSFTGEAGSAPYWSPDSRFILLDGLHSLSLIDITSQQQRLLLSDDMAGVTGTAIPGANALLQPLLNSLWAADSRHFLIPTRSRLFWLGQKLSSGNGIYTASINEKGQVDATASVVDTGNDIQAGWSYENPDTSFLFL